MYYVGHQGQFDVYVHSDLKRLMQEYPQINYAVVLAYMPGKKTEYDDYTDTMLPEGIESVHPHYTPSHSATTGYSGNLTMWSPTSLTPGVEQHSLSKKQAG